MKKSKTTFSLIAICIASIIYLSTSLAMAQQNTPPTISISTPSDSAWFSEPSNIAVITDANDIDGTVTKVEFYSGATKIGEDTIPDPGTGTLPKHWHESRGFGTSTQGGLGGMVYKVTNLDNSGPGSFRDAVSGNNRLVVFEVGGIIDLNNDDIDLGSNVTIAGQTAPSPGITLIRANVSADGDNTVVSHITILLGKGTIGEKDVANIRGDNVVFDHVTASWSLDEVLSIHGVDNVTLYKCIIAEGLQYAGHVDGEHSKGSLINNSPSNLSLIGCLYAHNAMRNPRCDRGEIFIANQVNYNWTTGWDEPEPHWFDWVVHVYEANVTFVGNVALQGPESIGEIYLDGHISSTNYACMDDNIIIDQAGNDLQVYDVNDIVPLNDPPLWPTGFEALPAHESLYENLRTVGSRPGDRDTHNSRIIATVADGNGEVIDSQDEVGGYPVYSETSRSLSVPDGTEARQEWLDSLEDEIAVDTSVDLSRLYTMVGSQASDKLRSDSGFVYTWNDVKEGTYALTAVATDDSGDTTTSSPVTIFVEKVAVTGVAVSPTSASIGIGSTKRLISTVAPTNATNKNVIWSSSDTLVATVNAAGLVTGVAEGSATITVTTEDGSYTGTSSITVSIVITPVTRVTVWPIIFSLDVGSSKQLTATVEPSEATNKNVSWSSGNTSVATVDSSGLVTGVAAGSTIITVTTQDGSKTATSSGGVNESTVSAYNDNNSSKVANTGMVAYPNPVSGQLKIALGKESLEDAYIQLFDNTGRMVVSLKSTGTETTIDTGSLSAGLYLIKVSSGRKCIVQYIVKK